MKATRERGFGRAGYLSLGHALLHLFAIIALRSVVPARLSPFFLALSFKRPKSATAGNGRRQVRQGA